MVATIRSKTLVVTTRWTGDVIAKAVDVRLCSVSLGPRRPKSRTWYTPSLVVPQCH